MVSARPCFGLSLISTLKAQVEQSFSTSKHYGGDPRAQRSLGRVVAGVGSEFFFLSLPLMENPAGNDLGPPTLKIQRHSCKSKEPSCSTPQLWFLRSRPPPGSRSMRRERWPIEATQHEPTRALHPPRARVRASPGSTAPQTEPDSCPSAWPVPESRSCWAAPGDASWPPK